MTQPCVAPLLRLALAASIAATGLGAAPALAHEGTSWEIRQLDARLAGDPGSAPLHLKRGEAYRARGDWRSAQLDYEAARRLAPGLAAVDLAEGWMWVDAGRPAQAEAVLDTFLARDPSHPTARSLRARARTALGRPLEAADDLTNAIEAAGSGADPEWYLDRAAALAAAGPSHRATAIAGLDEGRARLGPLLLLDLAALDLEVAGGDLRAALARLDRIAAGAPRREQWLVRRGEILERLGRPDEARLAYAAALTEIATLPASRRDVAAVGALQLSARDGLERLAPDRGASP
jgi:tetratricopeptide (TPR) repeat protein